LRGAPDFDPCGGTLGDVVAEISRVRRFHTILSDEDLTLLYDRPQMLIELRDALTATGARSSVLLFVRAHDEYVESVYAEAVKHGIALPFGSYLDEVMRHGELRLPAMTFPFAFQRLAEFFADGFGRDATIVSGYRRDGRPSALLRGFFAAAGIEGERRLFDSIESALGYRNRRATTGDVIRRLFATTAKELGDPGLEANGARLLDGDREAADQPFVPLAPGERADLIERFAADAACLVREWNVAPSTFERRELLDTEPARGARELFARAEALRLRAVDG
jgi:hypothetical protein